LSCEFWREVDENVAVLFVGDGVDAAFAEPALSVKTRRRPRILVCPFFLFYLNFYFALGRGGNFNESAFWGAKLARFSYLAPRRVKLEFQKKRF